MISREQKLAHLLQQSELFEACEPRLVFSAQPLIDTLLDSPAIYPQLAEAHESTGNDWVQAQYGLTGAGQTVAIIDSGIAWDHEALGQGYGPGFRVVGGWDFAENDANPYDDGPAGFHGTHVSGIVGSDHEDAPGVAREVDLVALRVFDDHGAGNLEWVESALQWVNEHRNAFENPITAVNLSVGTLWSGDESPDWGSIEDEFRQLHEAGIVITAAAGNDFADAESRGLSYPASSSYVTPVASLDQSGALSSFSQRVDGILAAPGDAIKSSVPDHLLGRDGQLDDFLGSSGTSMSAPYVAGASVLVRQAMEMTGWESIDSETIMSHLHSTADTRFDPVAQSDYLGIDLRAAIDAIIPSDAVGDYSGNSALIDENWGGENSAWINSVDDRDVYQFTPQSSGEWQVGVTSEWISDLDWSVRGSDQEMLLDGSDYEGNIATLNLEAGQTYELWVSADNIGPLVIDSEWSTGAVVTEPGSNPTALGTNYYSEQDASSGESFTVVASQDGIFTAHWEIQPDQTSAASGGLQLFRQTQAGYESLGNTTDWEAGVLRLDVPVTEGDQILVTLPSSSDDLLGELTLSDRLQLSSEGRLTIAGTAGQDHLRLDLSQGNVIHVGYGKLDYEFNVQTVNQIELSGSVNRDVLEITGSVGIDKVDLKPEVATLENGQFSLHATQFESIDYQSGGGADRVYIYDSDGDDTLSARPGSAELKGAGYEYSVAGLSRIFVHATGAGEDYAYLYDSPGDDTLSMRPQFTSMSGDDFFNYVRGFERVFVYANAGGEDVAKFYDSAENDRFSSSGTTASLTGPGFASFARGFESVTAYAEAGGEDIATLYGNQTTQWQSGADFVQMDQTPWSRLVRGFESVEASESGASIELYAQSIPLDATPNHVFASEIVAASHESTISTPNSATSPTEAGAVTLDQDENIDPLFLPELSLLEDPSLEGQILDRTFEDFEDLLEDD